MSSSHNNTSLKRVAAVLGLFLVGAACVAAYLLSRAGDDPAQTDYLEHCAACHGDALQGSGSAPALVGEKLKHGDQLEELLHSISRLPVHSESAWHAQLSGTTTKAIALYISEQRQQFPTTKESYTTGMRSPDQDRTVDTELYRVRVEHFATLASRPYSLAPLPDGSLLVSEKTRGLSIVDTNGVQGDLMAGTPQAWEELVSFQGSHLTLGSMLDVELHPDFSDNGWIYLSHADRCQWDCNSAVPQTMVRVVRGRISEGNWVDEEEIWSVHHDYYTVVPDAVAAGRLAFDKAGHVYVSVGGKSVYKNLHNMDTPYGKVHRVNDNGTVPADNPFFAARTEREESSTRRTVFSYGHRTIQGLTSNPNSGEIWGAEMGPRGGDEINAIAAGGNYGWPLYTEGLDYDGTPITIGEDLGLDYTYEDTVAPVVDFSPAPALSNLTFYEGDQFPAWNGDMLVGSLKAQTLYRVRVRNGELLEQEKLVTGLGRIRDVEVGRDGLIYVAIEHGDNGSIIRLSPCSDANCGE